MSKYTPAPWEIRGQPGSALLIVQPETDWPVAILEAPTSDPEVHAANARLIAAAPDMLDALEQARLFIEDDPQRAPAGVLALAAQIDAAIAKAKCRT